MEKRSNGLVQKAGWKEYAAAMLLTLGFFSIFYPEFTLAGDTYSRVGQPEGEGQIGADYRRILNAQEGEVEVRLSFLDRAAESPRREMSPGDNIPGENFPGDNILEDIFPADKARSAKKE